MIIKNAFLKVNKLFCHFNSQEAKGWSSSISSGLCLTEDLLPLFSLYLQHARNNTDP
jgi:hypothetical protein